MKLSILGFAKYALLTFLIAAFFIAYENSIRVVFFKAEQNAYESEFNTVKHDNSLVYYHSDIQPALDLIKSYLNKAKIDNLLLFDDVMKNEVSIKIHYDENEFRKIDTKLRNYVGLYTMQDKVVHILVKDCFKDILSLSKDSRNFKQYLLHEYTHYAIDEFMNYNNIKEDSIPMWFSEGIADYIGWEGADGNDPIKLVPFNEIKDIEGWQKLNSQEYSIYEQSHYAVSEIISLKGKKVIKEIMLKTKELSFEAAFKEVVGFTIEEYYKMLQEDLQNKWEKYNSMTSKTQNNSIDYYTVSQCLEEYIIKNPARTGALLDLCLIYENLGEFEKARAKYKIAAEKDYDNSGVLERYAAFSKRMGDPEILAKAKETEELLELISRRHRKLLPYLIL